MLRFGSLPLLAGLALGCGHTVGFTQLEEPPRRLAARAPETVEIFVAEKPARRHVEIGLIEIDKVSPDKSANVEMVSLVRTRAAEIGCDGVVLTDRASCIVFTDPPATTSAAIEAP